MSWRVPKAMNQGDFAFLGWVYGRRVLTGEHARARSLEQWFMEQFPRRRGKGRSFALQQWRAGYFRGVSGT